jgi:hypothetical protein
MRQDQAPAAPADPLIRLLIAVPLALIALAYAAICAAAGTPWPWDSVCHEGGQRTLLTTVFYFQHAVRELPLDVILGVAVAGAVQAFLPHSGRSVGARPRSPSFAPAFAGMAMMAVCATMLLGSAAVVGGSVTAKNLAQMFTRPGAELAWGAHWRYHLLAQTALILAALALAGLHRAARAGRFVPLGDTALYRAALFLFATLTLVFRPSLEPLYDPLFLGHQARELANHGLITLPLALGAALWVVRRRHGEPAWGPGLSSFKPVRGAALVAALIAVWLGAGALLTGAAAEAQTSSLTALLAGHVFEHSFGYAVVPLTAATLVARALPARAAARAGVQVA